MNACFWQPDLAPLFLTTLHLRIFANYGPSTTVGFSICHMRLDRQY
jgi:hypothetical protein